MYGGWLGWSDEQQKFTKDKELREFYGWMKGEKDDDGELGKPKLPEARSVRDLSKILDDPKALTVLRSSDGTLTDALARMEADHQIEFTPTVLTCETDASLSPDAIRCMTQNDITTLTAAPRENRPTHGGPRRVSGRWGGQVQP